MKRPIVLFLLTGRRKVSAALRYTLARTINAALTYLLSLNRDVLGPWLRNPSRRVNLNKMGFYFYCALLTSRMAYRDRAKATKQAV